MADPHARAPVGHVPPSGRADQKRSDWDRHREGVRRANLARRLAVNRLIERHWDSWVQLYGEEAAKVDVVPAFTQTRNRLDRQAQGELDLDWSTDG